MLNRLLLILIFARPFFSARVYPDLNLIYSIILLAFLAFWLISKKTGSELFIVIYCNLTSYKTKLKNNSDPVFKYPILFFTLALAISLIFSLNKTKSFFELYKYIIALLLFLIAVSLSEKGKLAIIKVILWAGLCISVIAFYQYFFSFRRTLEYLAINNISDSFATDFLNRQRILVPFVSPNTLGGYLAMLLPLCLIKRSWAWMAIPLAGALILTKSIGALGSLFLALSVCLFASGRFKKKWGVLLAALLLIIGLTFIARQSSMQLHTQPTFSTEMRLSYWKDTWKIIANRPLTGIGLGNFNLPQARHAHNSYLQIWAEMGILGLLSFLWLAAVILKSAWQQKEKNRYLLCAILVFLIHNLIDFSFFLPEVSLIWWVIMGLMILSAPKQFRNSSL